MSEISEPSNLAANPDPNVLKRIVIIMSVLLAAAIIISLFLADRLVTAGLVAGGLLSFVNFYWLKASLGQMLGAAAASGQTEPVAVWFLKFNLRFISLIFIILAVYLSGVVSLVALFGGLLSLAGAIVIEGFIQLFLAVFKRKEV